MYKILQKNFTFVSSMDMEAQRIRLGYAQYDDYPYLLKMHTLKENYDEAYKLSQNYDIMIAGGGSYPLQFFYDRMSQNRLTFRYTERYFNNGKFGLLSPKNIYYYYKNNTRYRNKNLYMLCGSGYAAADMKFIKSYPSKMFKWGYFPELKEYNINTLMEQKTQNKIPKILWAGRFIDWKHPDHAIRLAYLLKNQGYKFILNIVGTGENGMELKALTNKLELNDFVHFTGSMSPEDVRKDMEEANIFLFTSDSKEGWGVVLNEALNSGCAVVASHAIGAVPFLIKDNLNGLVYRSGDVYDLFEKVKLLLDKKELQIELGINAYKAIQETWNQKVATTRFLDIAKNLISGRLHYYDNGPMSKAD